jgi:hypothetical protein
MIALDVTAPTRLRVRNASPSLLLAQKFLAIFRGAGSAHFAEHSGKVLLSLEAARHRDVQDSRLGGAQHFLRTLYPLADNKLMRALAHRLAKHLREMSRAQPR